MDARTRTSWTHNEPAIWWSSFLACVSEKVVLEVFWNDVVFEKSLSLGMLSVVRIENIQRRVVLEQSLDGRSIVGANLGLIHVLHVVLDLHLHRISLTWDEEAV